ncbi:GGDEF domain-containing protein [Marinimicrobium sp. ABcell2]|uniref:GGDEF domain-containing protein n=1 Tax=Marinimicrobium sp. ABcell2 TaxID=3069751 RepID=UPI0027B5DE6F|nr:GGDEF domain-containing protein [Marinimicrobium sp. ABcell2]MDQ2076460.1 GGDEF domain-containing protein [Marinimicrobium sp. ABcell2]
MPQTDTHSDELAREKGRHRGASTAKLSLSESAFNAPLSQLELGKIDTMGSHYIIALVTLLLTVLGAFGWALAVFYGGISIPPAQVDWHDVSRMLMLCLTAFTVLCIAIFLPVRRSMGVKLTLGFGLIFIGAWQELLNTLIINRWALVLWLEVVCFPGGLLAAGWGLYQLGRQYRLNRLLLQSYHKVERELATMDQLTQLYNRRSFFAICSDLLANAAPSKPAAAVVCLRIHNLPEINKKLGFAAGDEVLTQVAKLIRRHTRSKDISARLGARRLVVFMPGASLPEAEALAQRVVQRSEHMVVTNPQGREVPLHVEVVYSLAAAEPDEELEPLLRRAGAVACN